MAHEGFVAQATSGQFGASAPSQCDEFLRNHLDECHASDRWHFWWLLKCLRQKRSDALFDGW